MLNLEQVESQVSINLSGLELSVWTNTSGKLWGFFYDDNNEKIVYLNWDISGADDMHRAARLVAKWAGMSEWSRTNAHTKHDFMGWKQF